MPIATEITAQQNWPDAAVAIAGIALIGGVVVVVVWQALATWRARIAVQREAAYRQLAEQLARELRLLNARLAERERAHDEERR